MNVSTRNRAELKGYFQKNDIPTEGNFAELIDAMLNQKEDGLARPPGDPLSIEAAGDDSGPQKLLNFYGKFGDPAPNWSLSLNQRTDPANPKTARPGLAISDGGGNVRLFIDRQTGRVGVGTANPGAPLDVGGVVRLGLAEGGSGPRSISFARDDGDESNAGKIVYRGFVPWALSIVGAGKSAGGRAIKMWDDVTIAGTLIPSFGGEKNAGIRFQENPGGVIGDAAWIRYYARSGESSTLEMGVSNDNDDHICLMPSGNVGVGVGAPKGKLHVDGDYYGKGHLFLHAYEGDGKNGTAYIQARDYSKSSIDLQFRVQNGPNLLDAVRIDVNGNVGINVGSPAAKLDIAGGCIVLRNNANDDGARALLPRLPPTTLIIGGIWDDKLYFYWKDSNSKTYRLMLDGKPF